MLVGDTPTPPAVGHRPSALPHSRGYASRPMSYAKVSRGRGARLSSPLHTARDRSCAPTGSRDARFPAFAGNDGAPHPARSALTRCFASTSPRGRGARPWSPLRIPPRPYPLHPHPHRGAPSSSPSPRGRRDLSLCGNGGFVRRAVSAARPGRPGRGWLGSG